jgi:DMSO/TMAO reductase YedYZ molybdopterin-dependent catalytic subunit
MTMADVPVSDLTPELEQVATPVSRRVFLALAGLGVAGIAVGGTVADWLNRSPAGTLAARTGLNNIIPLGERFRYYTVTDGFPSRSRAAYRLRVTGLVDRPMTLTYDELVQRPATHLTKDFQCVTGWRVEGVKWTGVRLAELLDEAGVQRTAKALRFTSFDGAYTESLTLAQARRPDVIVAHQMLGGPITTEHGGPVRLYVAPMYGYKSCKWLDGIEVVDRVMPGYWELEGYDVDAWIGRSNGRDDQPV